MDGVLERTRTRADAYNGYTNPRLNIGQCPKGSYLNGELEEYAIWHNVLTYQEILDLYLRGAAKLNCSTFSLLLPTSALAIVGLPCISSAFY